VISLRARIAVLVVAAIVAVVGLATFVAINLLGEPGPRRQMDPAGQQIHLIARLLAGEADPTIALMPAPLPGDVDQRMTRWLRSAIDRTGDPIDVVVTRGDDTRGPTASIRVGNRGWYALPLSDRPPPPGWDVLLGWLALVTLGAALVAIVIANRMIRPLTLLDDAVAAVGPSGTLPRLPEDGPAEVRATARAINRLSDRLHAAMESRMRLVAAAGHDLRTPMTRMRLRAEFVEDEEERALWLADLEELDRIADSAIRLVREEVAEAAPEPLSLDQLLRALADDLVALGLPVRTGTLAAAEVRGEPLALTRALRNLAINAATHGGGATIGLAVEGREAVVRIEDEGPGIPEPLLDRVFEPFFRVDQARRQSVPGAGLGLAIAREIVARLGGTIVLANRAPKGLRQEIRLPLA
jgi:signal transduction histidine kinase